VGGSSSTGKRATLLLVAAMSLGLAAFPLAGRTFAAQPAELAAAIVSGTCDAVGAGVAALTPATVPGGPALGSDKAVPGANSFSTVAIGIDALLADDHAVVVNGANGTTVTCGEIGGRLTAAGSLIVGLHPGASELGGVVVFSPADAAGQTNVSLFVVGAPLGTAPADAAPTSPATSAETPAVSTMAVAQQGDPTATTRPTEAPVRTPTPVPIGFSQRNPAPIGTTLESQGLAVTVTGASFDSGFANAIPRGGYKVLIISATIENTSDGVLGYDASRFGAIDANNRNTYDPVTIDNAGGLLTSGNLQPGEEVSGTAVVEVQETASNVIVTYDVDIQGDYDMFWQ
jgi:hypothetical protein